MVQGKISERPRWEVGKNLNVSAEAELNLNNQLTENCFFRVHLDEPVVTLYDEKNQPITMLGDGHPTNLRGKPRTDFQPGRFVHPHDAIFLQDGSILVAEWVPIGRVTRLVKFDG